AQLWHVYVLATMLGIGASFDAPARQAFVSEVVPGTHLANAVALNSANFNLARLAGPGVAGAVIALVGTGPAFLLNGASFLAVISSLVFMRKDALNPSKPVERAKGQVREGIAYVKNRKDLLLIFFLAGVIGTSG
ncbi:MFS transporter, partial [Escherichia coli]|nr:MFS transporter [Escherichia coli]